MAAELTRVRYDIGETGWALDLGNGLVQIANLPMTDKLRYKDICTTKDDDGWRCVDEVVHREYPNQTHLWYYKLSQFHTLKAMLSLVSATVEGGIAPRDDHPGFLTVNFHDGIDPVMLAEAIGIEQPKSEEEEAEEPADEATC